MTKITLSVCKVYRNTGRLRFHRKKTKKGWKHYFLDDETDEWKFNTEWVDAIKAQFLKLKKRHKTLYFCFYCNTYFYAYVKNKTQEVDCINGCDSENS